MFTQTWCPFLETIAESRFQLRVLCTGADFPLILVHDLQVGVLPQIMRYPVVPAAIAVIEIALPAHVALCFHPEVAHEEGRFIIGVVIPV